MLPEFLEIVDWLRVLMRKHAPEATELVTYGIPGWRINHVIAVISPTKKDITFAFSKGASFEDKYHRLKGVGKVSKHIKIKTLNDVSEDVLRYYIRQAVDMDV